MSTVAMGVGLYCCVYPTIRYSKQHHRTQERFHALYDAPPDFVPANHWNLCVSMVHVHFGSTFLTAEYSSYDQLKSFDRDLQKKLEATPAADSGTLWWIWGRLENVDSKGGRHTATHRAWFEENMILVESHEE